jgi:hypothetical protein
MRNAHEMISRIASRVARRFLRRRAAGASTTQLVTGGTVQIGNRAAKYFIRQFDGSLTDCRFRIFFDVLGAQFLLTGQIDKGHTTLWAEASGADPVDASQMKRHFGADPELWVKRALADALIRTVGEGDLNKWVVMDGEVLDSSVLDELDAAVHQPEMPALAM